MPPKKKLKGIRSGFMERGLSIAKLTLQAGTNAAAYSIGNLFAADSKMAGRKSAMLVEQMGLLATEFGELKGSLMKVGQMLSVYGEHFLPPEANLLLKSLQFESPPLEWPAISKHLNRQLTKEKVAELEIEQEPIAAASMGQVHRARIKKTGEEIVLKIQYPGVEEAIDGDIRALKRLFSMAKIFPNLPSADEIFSEIRTMLMQELDYQQEAATLLEYRKKFAGDKRFIIPELVPEYSAKRVIAMHYEPGTPIDSKEVAALSQERRNAIGVAALDFYFRELLELKMVQTDPHFGNYRLRIGKTSDQLVLYDFGAVRRFSADFLAKYKEFLAALFFDDRARFLKAAIVLGIVLPDDTEEAQKDFWELCSMVMEPFLVAKDESYEWGANNLAKRVAQKTAAMVKEHKARIPPRELVFLDRKMAGQFTFLSVLKVKINGRSILAKYLK